ncbi:sugar isomerase domain-containing protein [Listeria monocytogenes]|uniref:UPF0309 protein FV747_00290 n=1 Tax=Listeria monocytogenes TaxID=1639 RepID=A0A826EJU7_LISMN|nr:sugar isomerase domain-containing protein [Listeria monocytogenes]EAH0056805.1 sugar isomerase domain-containing protein [Listeria monocytogenes]EAH0103102.1 sugar isomerase domain-containing protein [Listeria monocytogenes]EAH0263739.1 sugar isomerase domain-containing protein [Listeria monocytogenes]EAH0428670.1 sugar isomerase domain-containing protein [Listeria monocytogenes]
MINNYIDITVRLLENILDNEADYVKEAGAKVAESIENDGVIHLFGCGHSHILTEEVFYRAGGLAAIHPILHEPLMLHEGAAASSVLERKNDYAKTFMAEEDIRPGDIMIVLSTSGRNPVPIDVAEIAREKGAFVIVITSLQYSASQKSRHTSGKRLSDTGDIVIDNGAVKGDAVLKSANFDIAFAPTSTVTGAIILQSIFAEAIETMVNDNFTPPVFISGNVENADAHNQALVDKYNERIPLLGMNL